MAAVLLFWNADVLAVTVCGNVFITITAEIHARSLANFYCQYADKHMNSKFMRRVSERDPAIRQFVIEKKIDVSF